jgi:alkaline phosphatase D
MRPVSRQNPVLATEFCGTSVTSNSLPQARTQEHLERNPHMKYGRSDKRGYIWMEVTPKETRARFMGLDDVRDAKSKVSELAGFTVADGRPGIEPS